MNTDYPTSVVSGRIHHFIAVIVDYRLPHIGSSLVGYPTIRSAIVDYLLRHISSLIVGLIHHWKNKQNKWIFCHHNVWMRFALEVLGGVGGRRPRYWQNGIKNAHIIQENFVFTREIWWKVQGICVLKYCTQNYNMQWLQTKYWCKHIEQHDIFVNITFTVLQPPPLQVKIKCFLIFSSV